MAGTPASNVDAQKLIVAQGPYVPLRTLELENAYPVLQGYKNTAGIGYHVNIEDPLQFASLGITAAYTPENNLRAAARRGHIDVTGSYRFWNAELSWNRSNSTTCSDRPGVAQGYATKQQTGC